MWLKGQRAVRMMETLNRKYDDTHNELGFVANEDANAPNPWCVVCREELANEVIRPSPTNHHHHHYHRHGGFVFAHLSAGLHKNYWKKIMLIRRLLSTSGYNLMHIESAEVYALLSAVLLSVCLYFALNTCRCNVAFHLLSQRWPFLWSSIPFSHFNNDKWMKDFPFFPLWAAEVTQLFLPFIALSPPASSFNLSLLLFLPPSSRLSMHSNTLFVF